MATVTAQTGSLASHSEPRPVEAQVSAAAPLDGLTVLEVSSFVAAPLGGMTLAQLGADVIRIDPVGGGADLHRWPLAHRG